MPTKCLVLDIETIPSSKRCLDPKASEYPIPIFQEIVSLSYAILDNNFEMSALKVFRMDVSTEEEALRAISKDMEGDTMLVTWSGRRFDVPVILYRSMKAGLNCKWYFQKDFDKRFNLSGHVDLQDHMTLFGATEKLRLDHAATMLGLPGKSAGSGVTGGDVEELWARNQYAKVAAYNVADVVQLAVLFVRWAHLRGAATAKEVNDFLNSIESYTIYAQNEGSEAARSVSDGINSVISSGSWPKLKIKE